MPARTDLVDLSALAHLSHVHVAARAVVDGFHTGIHRSQRKGQSVDFADHRPYVSGDDIRHLDWKILGRNDRLVIRRYEAESDLCCWLLLDRSASMNYQGERAVMSKWRYAAILAATVGYLIVEQHDALGQIFLDERPAASPRYGSSRQHFQGLCAEMDAVSPSGETTAAAGLDAIGRLRLRRGLVLVFSDLLDDPDELAAALDRLLHRGHTPALIWVLDPDERDLGIDAPTEFIGLEDSARFGTDPRAIREAYQSEVRAHHHTLARVCQQRGVPLIDCLSTDPPRSVLHRLLVILQGEKTT
ncbi:MAG: DUF58 domain-containing protein [Planctomycetota bacterium]